MAKIKKILLGLCFILISGQIIHSQEIGLPEIINFNNSQQEFSQDQIWQIKESYNGLLYFATTKYFLEFDGYTWRILKKDNSNNFCSFDIDSNIFYFGLKKGIYWGKLNSDQLNLKELNIPTQANNVWRTFHYKNKIYFFLNRKDAIILNNNTLEFVKRPSNFEIIRGFLVDNKIYAVSINGIAEIEDNKLNIISHNYDNVYAENIRTILHFDTNNLLIGTLKGSLWLMNKKSMEITKFNTDFDTVLEKCQIYFATNYNDSTFILTTLNNGIFIFSSKGHLLNHFSKKEGLPSNSIYYAYVDKSKNIWLGTSNGASYIKYNSSIFFFDERSNLNEKLFFSGIYSNFLLASTYNNLLKTDLKANKTLKEASSLQFSNNYLKVKIKNKDYLIFGGYYEIQVFDQQMNFLNKSVSSNKNILLSFPFDSSKFYVATNEGLSLWQIKSVNNKISLEKIYDYVKIPFMISKIYNDKFNDLWISTENLLLCIDYSTSGDNFKEYFYDKKSYFPESRIFTIFETNKKIYFSTDSGLFYITNNQTKNKKWKFLKDSLNINPLIFNSKIYSYVKDLNNLYFITDTGVIRSTNDLKQIKLYKLETTYDEMQTNISIYNNYLIFNDISKIYCLNKTFTPVSKTKYARKTLLRAYQISENPIIFIYASNDSVYLFKKSILSKNNIDFWFYNLPLSLSNTKYSYKIENKEDKWQEIENNKLSFRYLKTGRYIIKIKSENPNGEQNSIITIIFKIKAPFYLSLFAIIIYIILLIGTIFIIIFSSLKIIRVQKNKLEKQVQERTEQLEEKNEEIESQSKLLIRQKSILEKETNRLKLAMIELQQLSLVAQKTDNSVLILEKNGKFEWWNRGFVDLFNYKLNKYKNLPLREAHRKIRPDIFKEIFGYTVDKGTISYTNHEVFENDESIWYQTMINPIIDENNELIKFVVIDTNITETKNHEQIIQNQNDINKIIKDKLNKTKSDLVLKEEAYNKLNTNDKIIIDYSKHYNEYFSYTNKSNLSQFKKFFFLNLPYDLLSGDFLWTNNYNSDEIFIAFGDASGHRLKGQINAIFAISILKEIYFNSPKNDVNTILDLFNTKIKEFIVFGKNINENFNLALLKINKKTKEIKFSSSKIPLYMMRRETNYNFYKFNPNKFNIDSNSDKKFDQEIFNYNKNDRFYLITDGWANQFGKLGVKKYTSTQIRDFLMTIQDFDLISQKTLIQAEINKWKGSFSQLDDILVFGFEIE